MKKADKKQRQIKYQALTLEIAEKALNGEIICVNELAEKYGTDVHTVIRACSIVRELINAKDVVVRSRY